MMQASLHAGAALCEIGACFAFWTFARRSRAPVWLAAGGACLLLFGCALASTDGTHAGQAAVGYLGVYVLAGFAWARRVEGFRPADWNVGEAGLCALGLAMVAAAIALS